MPRFFTLLEAEELLPEVERLIRALVQHRDDYTQVDAELNGLLQRIAFAGGMLPPRAQIAALRSRKEALAHALKSAFEKLQETGCLLKDIDTGLVDFPTLYRDREVYLCWRLDEPGIAFWHDVEAGFAGRRPIDGEFLANHRGDT